MDRQERRQKMRKVLRSHSESMPITMTSLADLFHVSVRTIASDLDALSEEAEESGIEILRRSGMGVWARPVAREGAAKAAGAYVMRRKERRDAILLRLLSGKIHAGEELAELLGISRNTFLEDLKEVKETLARYALSYHSRRGAGIWAEGGEQEIRDMLIHIFAKGGENFKHYEGEAPEDASFSRRAFRRYARDLPIRELSSAFLALMRRWGILDDDDSLSRMIVALAVQLRRIGEGHAMRAAGRVSFLSDEGREVARLADEIGAMMEAYAPEARSAAETEYLVKELLHSKIFVAPKREALAKHDVDVRSMALARRFVRYAQTWLGEIYLDDDELVCHLAMHLMPAIERAHFGIVLSNPLLGKIKDRYCALYSIAKRAAERLGEEEDIHFSEDEIGYMTIHLGAAVERKKMQKTKGLSVLLVCGNGVGTANLMAMTLKSRLPYIDIAKTVSFYKLQKADLSGIDLVISTAPLELPHRAVLHVSPIMTQEEIEVISGQIEYFRKQKAHAKRRETVTEAQGLSDLLTPSVIWLDGEAASWEEAVRMSGELLHAAGAVTRRYVDRMVQCVKGMGAYIVVCPGVAMPHAGTTDGVRRIAVSFLRLKSPVRFPSAGEAWADLFFAFSTTDEERHRRLLEDLWKLFQDAEALGKLRTFRKPSDVTEFLRRFLERG